MNVFCTLQGSSRGGLGVHELPLQLGHPKVQGLAEHPGESRAGTEMKVSKRFLELLTCLWALLVCVHCCSLVLETEM